MCYYFHLLIVTLWHLQNHFICKVGEINYTNLNFSFPILFFNHIVSVVLVLYGGFFYFLFFCQICSQIVCIIFTGCFVRCTCTEINRKWWYSRIEYNSMEMTLSGWCWLLHFLSMKLELLSFIKCTITFLGC